MYLDLLKLNITHLKQVLIFGLIMLHCTITFGQNNTPKYSNEFLAIGINARALGMGKAYTAVANEVTAAYWNPAGLNNIADKYEVGLMHTQYFSGIANYDYIGFATKIDSVSTLAITAIRLGVDDIPDTRFLYDVNGRINYDNIQFFSAADYAFLFSYARKIKILGGLSVGGNAKIIYRHAGNFATAWGYGIDVGLSKSIKSFNFGLMLRDISGTYNTWSHNTSLIAETHLQTGNIVPESSLEITLPKATLGVSYTKKIKSFGILTSLDLETTFDGRRNTIINSNTVSIDPKIGIELNYLDKFFIRGGLGQIQEITNFDNSKSRIAAPNFGMGLALESFHIDYALTDIGDQTETPYSHVISLKISFNDKD